MAGLLASFLLLAGCTRDVAIALARQGDAVTVVASRRGGEPPCVQGVIITVAGADIATTPPLWELSTGAPNRCRTSFVYGQVPPGYAQSGSAPRLLAGSRYMAEIRGPGFEGGREFTFRADDGPMSEGGGR